MWSSVQKPNFCELPVPAIHHLPCSTVFYKWLCDSGSVWGFLFLYSLPRCGFVGSLIPLFFFFSLISTVKVIHFQTTSLWGSTSNKQLLVVVSRSSPSMLMARFLQDTRARSATIPGGSQAPQTQGPRPMTRSRSHQVAAFSLRWCRSCWGCPRPHGTLWGVVSSPLPTLIAWPQKLN